MQNLEEKRLNRFFINKPDIREVKLFDTYLLIGLLVSVLFIPFIKISNEFFLSVEEIFVGLVAIRLIFLRFFWIDKYIVLLISFGIYVVITIFVNPNRTEIREYFELYKFVKFALLYVFAVYYFISYTGSNFWNKFIVISFLILGVFNFLHYFDFFDFNKNITILFDPDQRDVLLFGLNSLGLPGPKRIVGTMGNPNDNAILFLFYLSYFQGKLVRFKMGNFKMSDYSESFYRCLYFICILLIVLCQSRTGVIAAILIFVLGIIQRKISLKTILIELGIIGLIVALMFGLDHLSMLYLTNTNLSYIDNSSVMGRLEIWKKLIFEWLQNPIFGYGPNKIYMNENMIYPENEYIFHLWRYGIPGFVFYCGTLWLLFVTFIRNNYKNHFFNCVVIFISVCALTNNPLTNPKFLIIFALVSGYSMSGYYQQKIKANELHKSNIK